MDKKPKKTNTDKCPLDGLNGQIMAMCAHGYCLGRNTYVASSCDEWLRQWWHKLVKNTRNVIIRDTIGALMDHEAGRHFDFARWEAFAEWSWKMMDEPSREWCRKSLAHKAMPWPLEE